MKALVLSVLLNRGGVGIREIQAEIEEITQGIEVGHSAVFMAGKSLAADGLVVATKEPRPFGKGPSMLLFRITEQGRAVAEDFREQAERLLYWPRFKAGRAPRTPSP